jgi:hypothetical protein
MGQIQALVWKLVLEELLADCAEDDIDGIARAVKSTKSLDI